MATRYTDFAATGGPHAGTSADPYTAAEWRTLIENGGSAINDIWLSDGIYTGAAVDVSILFANTTLDGWNRSEGGYKAWIVNAGMDYYGSAPSVDDLTTIRGCFNSSTIFSCLSLIHI